MNFGSAAEGDIPGRVVVEVPSEGSSLLAGKVMGWVLLLPFVPGEQDLMALQVTGCAWQHFSRLSDKIRGYVGADS